MKRRKEEYWDKELLKIESKLHRLVNGSSPNSQKKNGPQKIFLENLSVEECNPPKKRIPVSNNLASNTLPVISTMAIVSVVLLVIYLLGWSGLTGLATFADLNQTHFNLGTYRNTFFNTSGFVMLNITEGLVTGNFTSQVFDAGSSSTWNTIIWNQSAIGVLPNYKNMAADRTETAWGGGNVNLTSCIIYLRLDQENSNTTLFENYCPDYNWTCGKASATNSLCPRFNSSGLFNGSYQFNGTFISTGANVVVEATNIDVGGWVQAFNQRTVAAWVTVEKPLNNPEVIYEEGGTAQGLTLAYRKSSTFFQYG
ncbi:hypothetical protein HYX12_04600, partial [Candidatus Woesearchaeota archaeon]|nr:hypothetical protein [Candidatus Woesearchaeota archaeon]